MNKSTFFFFFGLLTIVLLIAHYNSRSNVEQAQQTTSPHSELVPAVTPVPPAELPKSASTSSPLANKAIDFANVVPQVQPAIVLISVFEPSGKLLKTGTGFFVSDDGRIMTSRSVIEGGAHAVATTGDGKIENISGVVEDAAPIDLAVLKAEVKGRVPFVTPKTSPNLEEGSKISVVASPLAKVKPAYFERAISKHRSDSTGEWLELSMGLPDQSMGSPVVNERGDVIGIIARGPGNPAVVVRTANAATAMIAQVNAEAKPKWLAISQPDGSVPPPAEGPLQKVPLAGTPHPGRSKLVFSPAPEYPSAVRASNVRGNGRFRVTFGENGQVRNVTVTQSTRNGALDQAAVDALRHWKAAPGEEWTLSVPITFKP